jgi:hypothetical protein
MNRVLKRPMFRMGGAAEGITSGLDRKPLKQGTDPYDRAMKTTERFMTDMDKFRGETPAFAPSALPGFLTGFGLNLLATPPQGNIFATAATAAKDPFQTFQAATLKRQQDTVDRRDDIFGTALASEYDLEAQKIKNLGSASDDMKTPEVERKIIVDAQKAIFSARDVLNNKDSTEEQKKIANQTIKINRNVLQKELGVPPEYEAIISSPDLFDNNETIYVRQYNDAQLKKIEEYAKNNPEVSTDEITAMFPLLKTGTVESQDLTFKKLNERFGFASGGRAGFKIGSDPKIMESVVEQKQQTGEVQDLSYTELRARLPQEISNDIVQLLSQSKQALLDFANIQTTEDISTFNQQYDVNLSLPSGA